MKRKILASLSLCFVLFLFGCKKLEAEEITPDAPKRNPEAAAQANISLGFEYLQKNRMDVAKAKFIQAVKDDPKLPASWYSLAYYLEVIGDTDEADRLYKKAVKLAPYDGKARNNYGTFLCRHHKYTKAVKEFLYAAKQPSYLAVGAAYENAGLCSILAGKRIAAKEFFKLALHNDPNRTLSYFELAKLNFDESNIDTAYKYFREYAHRTRKPMSDFYRLMFKPIVKNSSESEVKHTTARRKITKAEFEKLIWAHKPHPNKPLQTKRIAEMKSSQSAQPVQPRIHIPQPEKLSPEEAETNPQNQTETASTQQTNSDSKATLSESKYHIQFFASRDENSAEEFIAQLPDDLQKQANIAYFKNFYHVMVGNYENKNAAYLALRQLPTSTSQYQPWINYY